MPGKASELVDQPLQRRGKIGHGVTLEAGPAADPGRPASRSSCFCVSSSTFLVASLQAASTRSCSISTSPATSGSILTPVTFLWPSILTVTMPPPAEASTRISATPPASSAASSGPAASWPACFRAFSCFVLPQISDRRAPGFREKFLEPLHFRMSPALATLRRLPGRGVACRRRAARPSGGLLADLDRDPDRLAHHALHGGFEVRAASRYI